MKILDAVESLAAGETPVAITEGGVGGRSVKYEGQELSLGDRGFIDDMEPEGCLHGAVVLSEHARADIMAIDPADALAMPGVAAVLTADDVPGELRSGLIHKDWPAFIPVGGRTSYLGDVVALVVADTRAQARAATSAVSVTYDVHEPLTDPAAALASDEDAVWTLPGNELSRSTYARGDVDEALARSAHVARQTFQTQRIDLVAICELYQQFSISTSEVQDTCMSGNPVWYLVRVQAHCTPPKSRWTRFINALNMRS